MVSMLVAVVMLVWQSFLWLDDGLRTLGWSTSLWHSAIAWELVGVACALFWPLRYWKGMRGLWLKNTLSLALLSLAGPWALALGFPL